MAITAAAGAKYTPCPSGTHAAVCCDVVDLGIVKSNYAGKEKKQHKIVVVWQTGETRDDGRPFLVRKRYTLSLHEKAALRKDLESWRGVPFTEDQLQGWDVEAVIGAPAMLSVIHNAANGNVYANVSAIMRPPKGTPIPAIDPTYVREQDRPKDDTEGPDPGEWQATDDDVPFRWHPPLARVSSEYRIAA
jgi:hypothetical protein